MRLPTWSLCDSASNDPIGPLFSGGSGNQPSGFLTLLFSFCLVGLVAGFPFNPLIVFDFKRGI